MDDLIKEEKYKDHTIKIFQDECYDLDPNEWDNGTQLVNYHRDFEMTSDIISKDEIIEVYQGGKIPQEKHFFILPVSMLSHSGVCLSLNNSFSCDCGGWDTSHVGLILISKKEAKNKKEAFEIAKGTIKTWNSILSGEIYRMLITNNKTGKIVDSYGGFIGDFEKYGLIDDCKSIIDIENKEISKVKCKKTKALIKNKIPLSYRI